MGFPRPSSIDPLINEALLALTDLFPSLQTWYLFGVVVCLNAVDWVLFLVLDIGNGPITVRIPSS